MSEADAEMRFTDRWNAERLVESVKHTARYCYKAKSWLVWKDGGKRWEWDEGGEMTRRGIRVVDGIYQEGIDAKDSGKKRAFLDHARQSDSAYRIRSMVELAQASTMLEIKLEDLDRNPLLLNCQNGTVDLRTGKLHPHRPGDLITKICATDYNPAVLCLNWEAHLQKVFKGKTEMVDFVQRALGYSISGLNDERALFIPWGSGANGKTATIQNFADTLGDYAAKTSTETFMRKRPGSISNDLARLQGARFIYMSETEEGQRLAESLVKQFTGGDKITARFMYKEINEFYPAGKIWLSTNHRPDIRDQGKAIWDRIKLIPFTVAIPDEDQIPRSKLAEIFEPERPAILAWAARGFMEYQENGLRVPEEVKKATSSYREEMDRIQSFLDHACYLGNGSKVGSQALYEHYVNYSKINRDPCPLSAKEFKSQLEEKGYKWKRDSSGMKWEGVGIRVGAALV
jgi:putative DNA primase/helicase